MNNKRPKSSNWLFLLLWVFANTTGWIVIGIILVGFGGLSWVFGGSARENLGPLILVQSIGWIIAGTIISVTQSMVLHKKIDKTSPWILFTVIGWTISGVINAIIQGAVGGSILGRVFGWSLSGFIIGLAQWLVLRYKVSGVVILIPFTILSWVIAGFLSEVTTYWGNRAAAAIMGDALDFIFRGMGWVMGEAVGDVTKGVTIGFITGALLIFLFIRQMRMNTSRGISAT
jgi:hypothetical protein